MNKFKYKYTLIGIAVAGINSILLTLQRVIWDHYWRGWTSYLVLLFCTALVAFVVGISIDLILFHINRKRKR